MGEGALAMTDIDIWQLNLDAAYTLHGVEAQLDTATEPVIVTVIDKTDGVALGNEAEVQTVVPAATVRVAELAEHDIAREDLRNVGITFNGQSWTIKAARPRPTPTGESKAELLLILERDETT
jgi:hypothetical protein